LFSGKKKRKKKKNIFNFSFSFPLSLIFSALKKKKTSNLRGKEDRASIPELDPC